MSSKYWDDFERRAKETANAIKHNTKPPVRRVAVFITNRCNFNCKYCNHHQCSSTMPEEVFANVVNKYGKDAIIHITGGEPSIVPYLKNYLVKYGNRVRFHLNTNCYIKPPAASVRRLKVSLDHYDPKVWDSIVGKKGAFSRVVSNIKQAAPQTVVSITYTLSRLNYRNAVDFARFANKEFQDLYAVFFSIYKGTHPLFAWTAEDVNIFFEKVLPALKNELDTESLALLNETLDEKVRLLQGVRFPNNMDNPTCYLSMSERIVNPAGKTYHCSHLYRDGIYSLKPSKHPKCLYGCNRRLAMFNEEVEKLIRENGV